MGCGYRCIGGGGGATRPLPRDGDVEEFHGDPTVGPRPKVWTSGQKSRRLGGDRMVGLLGDVVPPFRPTFRKRGGDRSTTLRRRDVGAVYSLHTLVKYCEYNETFRFGLVTHIILKQVARVRFLLNLQSRVYQFAIALRICVLASISLIFQYNKMLNKRQNVGFVPRETGKVCYCWNDLKVKIN